MTMQLNIATDNYGRFIEQVRERARNPTRYSHNRPVLPDKPPNVLQAECFDIRLRADRALVVRIRRFDLYLIGFQMENGQWFEFKGEGGQHLIQGSRFLPFGENYNDLGGLGFLSETGLGYEKLRDAVNTLAADENGRNQKASLITIAVMLCESARFLSLSVPLAVAMHDKRKAVQFKAWMKDLINSWGDLSERLLIPDHNPDRKKKNEGDDLQLPKETVLMKNDKEQIKSALDAVECVALLKSKTIPEVVKLAGSPAAAAATTGSNKNNIQGRGQPMVEVFSVRIDKQTPTDLYGTIRVTDGLGSVYLYNRARNDPEPIRGPNETASLTGPARAISLCRTFTLDLHLEDSKHRAEVSKGDFSKDVFQLSTLDKVGYDERLSKTVGSATVHYTMFRTAVQANVSVALISTQHRDGKESRDPVGVYGSIVARYNHGVYATADQQKYYQTRLFNKPSNTPVSVRPGNPIPLSRSVVAVPTSGASPNLIIEAGLSDDNFAMGSHLFSAQLNGSFVKDIKGKYGSIRVTVAWSQVSQ